MPHRILNLPAGNGTHSSTANSHVSPGLLSSSYASNLLETRTFGSRVIYERYARAHDESA